MQYTEIELNNILAKHQLWLDGGPGRICADFNNADLRNANLSNADLSNGDFSNANLRNANLYNANLRNANLYNANLFGATFHHVTINEEITVNWDSHNLISAILLSHATTVEQEMFSAYVGQKTSWCWNDWLSFVHPSLEWALQTLTKYVKEDDDAPSCIVERLKTNRLKET